MASFQRGRTSKLRRVTEGQSLGSTCWTQLGGLLTPCRLVADIKQRERSGNRGPERRGLLNSRQRIRIGFAVAPHPLDIVASLRRL